MMNKSKAVKIMNSENSSSEEQRVARNFLISCGLMRINNGAYEMKAKADRFLSQIFEGEKWVFRGLISPYDN